MALNALCERLLLSLDHPADVINGLQARLRSERIVFGGETLPTFPRPHLVEGATFDRWIESTEALFRLIERLATRVLRTPRLSRWLGFTDEALALMEIDPGYPETAVIARPDAVTHGSTIRFIEINCDSPAMMTFADVVEEAMLDLVPLGTIRVTRANRTRALLDALLRCYASYGGKQSPTIAIVDWPGEKTAGELAKAAERFTQYGVDTLVATPSELHLEGRRLFARSRPVDLVYRRVLFRDFLLRAAELQPLIEAYRTGTICMVNPLRSYVVGTKALFALLHEPGNLADLSAEEQELVQRHLPETHLLKSAGELDPSQWVLKKAESYGGKDVLIHQIDSMGWEKIDPAQQWVCQRLETVPTFAIPILSEGRLSMVTKYLNWNPFVFGGRHGGSIARVSDSKIINISRGGGLLPSSRATSVPADQEPQPV